MSQTAPEHTTGSGRRCSSSDIFHSISQPLTALHCSLELSLLRDETLQDFRRSVELALASAQSLRSRLLEARELSDADDPGDLSLPVRFDSLLERLRQEFVPLLEHRRQSMSIQCPAVCAQADEGKLQRVLFTLLEMLVATTEAVGSLTVLAREWGEHVEVLLSCPRLEPNADTKSEPEELAQFPLRLTERYLQSLGGKLVVESNDTGTSITMEVPRFRSSAGSEVSKLSR